MSRNIQEKKEAKKPEKRRPNGDRKRDKSPKVAGPMVTDDHGCMVAGDPGSPGSRISANTPFFRFFSRFAMIGSCVYSNSDFKGMISIDLCQHHGSAVEIIRSSSDTPKSPTGRPRKHTFCLTDHEIDWTDVAGPLVATNV